MKQLNFNEFKNNIIEVLDHLELSSPAHINLQLGTTAVETDFGSYRRQIGFKNKKGGGYGINQIELGTYKDLIDRFLKNKQLLKDKILYWYFDNMSLEDNLILNDKFNIAICRLKYLSCEHLFKMPQDPNNIEELAKIWKKYYNTNMGSGTVDKFITAYDKYITL